VICVSSSPGQSRELSSVVLGILGTGSSTGCGVKFGRDAWCRPGRRDGPGEDGCCVDSLPSGSVAEDGTSTMALIPP
jgi:hypothetical protein